MCPVSLQPLVRRLPREADRDLACATAHGFHSSFKPWNVATDSRATWHAFSVQPIRLARVTLMALASEPECEREYLMPVAAP
jgi:hypothetical protein